MRANNASDQGRRCVVVACTDYHKVHKHAMLEGLQGIFGINGRFGANQFKTDSMCALYWWLRKLDITTFDTTKIPESEHMMEQKASNRHPVWVFSRTLILTRYIAMDQYMERPCERQPPIKQEKREPDVT